MALDCLLSRGADQSVRSIFLLIFWHHDCSKPDELTVGKNSSCGHMHVHFILPHSSTAIIVQVCIPFFLPTLDHFQLLHPIHECSSLVSFHGTHIYIHWTKHMALCSALVWPEVLII